MIAVAALTIAAACPQSHDVLLQHAAPIVSAHDPALDHVSGIVHVLVTVDAHGRAQMARVQISSTSKSFDEAVARAAMTSKYVPAVLHCRQHGGAFLWTQAFGHGPAKPACIHANAGVQITNFVTPDYPLNANAKIGEAAVIVRVTVDERGSILDDRVVLSSGNAALDSAARLAARQSSYLPRYVNCTARPGTFDFRANFSSN